MQRGFTLVEMAAALVILGILAALIGPRVNGWSDRIAVARAMEDIRGIYIKARAIALYRSVRVRIELSPDSLSIVAENGSIFAETDTDSTVVRMTGPNSHGVTLEATRNVIRFYPSGVGLGGSNTKIVLRRGAVAESLTVSRLGRLKRWP